VQTFDFKRWDPLPVSEISLDSIEKPHEFIDILSIPSVDRLSLYRGLNQGCQLLVQITRGGRSKEPHLIRGKILQHLTHPPVMVIMRMG